MSSGPAPPPGFEIVELSGPLIMAHLSHWGLFSALTVQLYLYYQAFPNDRPFMKCMVYTIYAIEVVQTVLLTRDAFMAFGYGFGDVSALTKIRTYWLTSPIIGGLVAFIGQSFYAYRVYVLSSRSWTIPVLIVVTSLVSSVCALISGGVVSQFEDLTSLNNNRKLSISEGVWLSTSALSDIIIAVCMTYYLSRNDPQIRRTRVLVSKLIRLIIETGSLTAAVALTGVALWFAFPGQLYYTVLGISLPTLYANTTLVVLNARFQILGGRGTCQSATDILSAPIEFQHTGANGGTTAHAGQSPIVVIERDVFSEERINDHQVKTIGDL
ncbi:hypothetical protein DFH09DRAFT_1125356 [Mycena vulgaris]|nr:hypothetical protein DFH09DRAFT_1125356 [Mycena vulgaris]